jgi:hypothetical protein
MSKPAGFSGGAQNSSARALSFSTTAARKSARGPNTRLGGAQRAAIRYSLTSNSASFCQGRKCQSELPYSN